MDPTLGEVVPSNNMFSVPYKKVGVEVLEPEEPVKNNCFQFPS
jgi:hypothetical protein